MSSRERKRAERQKRKQRTVSNGSDETGEALAAPLPGEGPESNGSAATIEDVAAEFEAAEGPRPSRSELRNREAREALEPLGEGERPGIVTIGAGISAAIAASILIAWIAGAEVKVGNTDLSERPNAFQVFPPAILFAAMAYGMWRSRYWAVLGFEAIMAILMVGSFITLIAATSAFKAITSGVVLLAAGLMFWFTVKALARIQMPQMRNR